MDKNFMGYRLIRLEVNRQWINNYSIPVYRGKTNKQILRYFTQELLQKNKCYNWDNELGNYIYNPNDNIEIRMM